MSCKQLNRVSNSWIELQALLLYDRSNNWRSRVVYLREHMVDHQDFYLGRFIDKKPRLGILGNSEGYCKNRNTNQKLRKIKLAVGLLKFKYVFGGCWFIKFGLDGILFQFRMFVGSISGWNSSDTLWQVKGQAKLWNLELSNFPIETDNIFRITNPSMQISFNHLENFSTFTMLWNVFPDSNK